MKLIIRAEGPVASGKTFILEKVVNLLEMYGFELQTKAEGIGEETRTLDREQDQINFLIGDKMIQLGDWTIELDQHNILIAVYHEGKDIYAREVEVNFSVGQLTTIGIENIIQKDSDAPKHDP